MFIDLDKLIISDIKVNTNWYFGTSKTSRIDAEQEKREMMTISPPLNTNTQIPSSTSERSSFLL